MKNKYKPVLLLAMLALAAINGYAQFNTRYGVNALPNESLQPFGYNSAFGAFCLYKNTTGSYNSAFGAYAMSFNTTGHQNTASGYNSLYYNTTGNLNTAFGYASLQSNNTGYQNTAIGGFALTANTIGHSNTASGYYSLRSNTIGYGNIASGYSSLYSNTVGTNNTASGYNSLYANNSGSYNTANGGYSLYTNITGNQNTACGYMSLFNNTGSFNVANGYQTMYSNTTGSANTATGNFAMSSNTTGGYNIGDGFSALGRNTTGYYNTALGVYADVSLGNLTNATAIGYYAVVNASNKVLIGNTTVEIIGGYRPWSVFSDGRFKESVKEDVPGLTFITRLRPVTYTINTKKIEEHLLQNMPDSLKMKRMGSAEDYAKAVAIRHTGFIAQEVEKTAGDLGYKFDGVNAPQNNTDNYSIAYSQFVIPLVKAVQELSKMNDEKDKVISNQQQQLDEIIERLNQLEKLSVISGKSYPSNSTTLSAASLGQNMPNPFTNKTTITYSLPQHYTNAQISVTDATGKLLKQMNITGFRKGSIAIYTGALSSGSYHYSLFIDGQLIGTKQMLLIK